MLQLDGVFLPGSPEPFQHAFNPGQICVVLGSNQSGKTDLCRLIAGLPTRATGSITLDGVNLGDVAVQHRSVAMVYQAFINYPNLTVAQNIASPMRAQGIEANQQQATVQELAAKLQIDALLDRYPAELSGGQQQRLAIARALAKGARVLLLDEPLVNLDFKLREALEVELRSLLQAMDTIVLYTSSDPRDAFALGDEVLLLERGQKLQAGAPMDVYTQPASLAAMQLLSDPGANLFARDGQLFAVRPEHLALGETKTDSLQFQLAVTATETNGDETFVHGQLQQAEQPNLAHWVVRCPGMPQLEIGAQIALSARAADVQQFEGGV